MSRYRKHYIFPVVIIITLSCFSTSTLSQVIHTPCEKSNFQTYTTYPEMMQYLQSVQATSTEMLLGIFGTSIEGREIPYAVFSRPMTTRPWEALVSGKPIILLTANIHGEERRLRESNLILIRELATKGTEINQLLDNLVVIMVPSLNPDGFVLKTHQNANNVNLNRDFIKLEGPELVSHAKNIIHSWHPHLYVDGHNGGRYPYNFCYQAPSNAAPDQRITLLFDKEIAPFIDAKMKENGYKSWYFARGNRTEWRTGIFDADNGRNYGGFINSVGILFESPGWQGLKNAVQSGLVAYKAILQYSAKNAERLITTINRARRETTEMGQNVTGRIPVQMKLVAEDYKVSYEIGEGDEDTRKIIKVTGADLIKKPLILKSRPRPYAYILERKAQKSVEMLKRQNVMIEVLQEETTLGVEAYVLTGVTHGKKYDHHRATFVTVADETVKRKMTFPKGTYIIRTGQMMGRVITHLLEPETNDNVITFNTMDGILPKPGESSIIPIFKLTKPTNLATRMLRY